MKTNKQTIRQYTVDGEFYNFVNEELLSDAVDRDLFWETLTSSLSQLNNSENTVNSEYTSCVSLLTPRYTLKALNARWGSLYSALYHEDAIPHSAGLKTGSTYNAARGSRVITYAKEFLDSAFPLTDGSHKDAVSYIVYFQNLMVILADGSTVGLQAPSQFAAKSGPKDDPESIVLKHKDLHVEIVFNRFGKTGSNDIANIDDIRIEATAKTLVGCHADSNTDKCATYRHLHALARGTLKTKFTRNGKEHARHLIHSDSYTAKNGDEYVVNCSNPMALQLSVDKLNLISDKNNAPIPTAIIDAVVAALAVHHNPTVNSHDISLMAPHADLADQIETVLDQLSNVPGIARQNLKLVTDTTNNDWKSKESTNFAATVPEQLPCIGVAEEELKNTVTMATQNGAVLKAIHHFGSRH